PGGGDVGHNGHLSSATFGPRPGGAADTRAGRFGGATTQARPRDAARLRQGSPVGTANDHRAGVRCAEAPTWLPPVSLARTHASPRGMVLGHHGLGTAANFGDVHSTAIEANLSG